MRFLDEESVLRNCRLRYENFETEIGPSYSGMCLLDTSSTRSQDPALRSIFPCLSAHRRNKHGSLSLVHPATRPCVSMTQGELSNFSRLDFARSRRSRSSRMPRRRLVRSAIKGKAPTGGSHSKNSHRFVQLSRSSAGNEEILHREPLQFLY